MSKYGQRNKWATTNIKDDGAAPPIHTVDGDFGRVSKPFCDNDVVVSNSRTDKCKGEQHNINRYTGWTPSEFEQFLGCFISPALKMLDAALKVLLESSKTAGLEQNTVGIFAMSVRIYVGGVAVISQCLRFNS